MCAATNTHEEQRTLRVVSLGGGTGQPVLIKALRLIPKPLSIDAVVAMADDGRSTGILREQEAMLPPGDVRKCLGALASSPDSPFVRAFEHRFSWLNNHAVGNLLMAALLDEGLTFPETIERCEEMLSCVGHVLPSTLDSVTLTGYTAGGERVSGQAHLSYEVGRLDKVSLEPDDARAYPPATKALVSADLVIMGPGSLFTSLLPNLLVSGIAHALRTTHATKLFVCPKADVQGEGQGMSAEDYIDALERHGVLDLVDIALFHRVSDVDAHIASVQSHPRIPDVTLTPAMEARLCVSLPQLMVRDMADDRLPTIHSAARLALALSEVMDACPLAPK